MSASTHFLLPDQVFDGVTLHRGAAVEVANGKAASMVPAGQVPTGPEGFCRKIFLYLK